MAAILTLSKLDAGVLVLNRKSVSAEELLSNAAQAVDPLLKQKKQILVIRGERELDLLCDPGWTAEAFGNLIKKLQ